MIFATEDIALGFIGTLAVPISFSQLGNGENRAGLSRRAAEA